MVESGSAGTRVRGKVVSWRKRGYGFITSPALKGDAWFHAEFVVDPSLDVTRPLPVGLEVEFEPKVVDGGKLQAHNVSRPARGLNQGTSQVNPAAPSSDTRRTVDRIEEAPRDVKIAGGERLCGSLASRVAAEKQRIEAERSRLQAEAEQLLRDTDRLEQESNELGREFDSRIAELQSERDRQLEALGDEVQRCRREVESIRARQEALPSVTAKSLGLLELDLRDARERLAGRVKAQTRRLDDAKQARAAAAVSAGEDVVRKYDEIRRRRAIANDEVERMAYELAEQASRTALLEYATALDLPPLPPEPIGVVVLAPTDRVVIAAPISPDDLDASDVRWRIGSFLVDAAERAGRELHAEVAVGSVFDCLAVELRPGVEPELVEVAVREAFDARPTLAAASFTLARELVPGIDPPFELLHVDDKPVEPHEAVGYDLRAVAKRLELPLPDLIASLRGAGLPYHDDLIEPGVEESLRQVLVGWVDQRAPADPDPKTAPTGVVRGGEDRSSPRMVASRLLAKLVRDRRFGARHTDESNAWGHHFADNEKAVARELVQRLVRLGILDRRTKGSSDHISIDTRRMDDVHQIIELRWSDASLFEGLE